MGEKSSSDTFGTYLELVQRKRSTQQTKVTGGNPLRLLNLLSKSEEHPVTELLKASELSVTEFAKHLEALERWELITIEKKGAQEVVKLTNEGEEFIPS